MIGLPSLPGYATLHSSLDKTCPVGRLTYPLQVFFIFIAAFSITGTYHGTGQHAQDIQPATEIPVGLKVTFSPVLRSELGTNAL